MNTYLYSFILALLFIFNPAHAELLKNHNQSDHSEVNFPLAPLYSNTETHKELFLQFLEKQNERIETLTSTINTQNELNQEIDLSLLNERGMAYFFLGQFQSAIHDFSYVINKSTTNSSKKTLLGTALWGRMLCHAFEDHFENTYNDALLISSFFNECDCEKNQEKEIPLILSNCGNSPVAIPIAKFAYPQEQVSKWECHDRTKTIADKMRSLAELIPELSVRKIVIWVIENGEEKAHQCCESGKHWTECLGPIADIWKKLENTWDILVDLFNRGINLRMFLTSPLNL